MVKLIRMHVLVHELMIYQMETPQWLALRDRIHGIRIHLDVDSALEPVVLWSWKVLTGRVTAEDWQVGA